MPENKLRIEILYPEICNLFGDTGNIRYLERCLPDAEFIYTAFNDEPAFVQGGADMIYMASTTERTQEKIIGKLMPYRQQLKDAIESDKVMLFTGNSMEILFNYIENDDGSRIEGLGIFDFYAKRYMFNRYNSMILAKYKDIDIVGFRTQFTMTFGDNSDCYFAAVERGDGINKESKLEGIHVHNFFGTNIVGPLLVLNPYFTADLLKTLGIENPELAFSEEIYTAYKNRLAEFKDPGVKLH
ncbi:MAG: hypothetical protein Q4F95_09205 [Oscillospiraceae bacterium]|nr:hypothetical protein [Oscillospiraceae bacterium]